MTGDRKSLYWDEWLTRPDLIAKIRKVRTAVTDLHDQNARSCQGGPLPFFTVHDVTHCNAVETLIHRLIPERRYLDFSEEERFYLLASAWVHDIGMLPMVAKAVWGKESISHHEIRSRHHKTSEKYLMDRYANCGLEESDKYVLSLLSRFHRRREDISQCQEEMALPGGGKVRTRLLAAFLRLADALHIDASRAPTPEYAVCLAYDIPQEAKFHWIKSKFVVGLDIDDLANRIRIDFRIPHHGDLEEGNRKWVMDKIHYIIKQVMEDLREELGGVMNVLMHGKSTFYTDVVDKQIQMAIDRQTLNDLFELIMNYDIMMAPSASKLMEIILWTIANISGYNLEKGGEPVRFQEAENVKKRVEDFISQLETGLLSRRQCHSGLKTMVAECREVTAFLPDVEAFIGVIDRIYQDHFDCRVAIRKKSFEFLELIASGNASIGERLSKDSKGMINIVLFGYSELVIRSLCGFRDHLIACNCRMDDFTGIDFYETRLESRCSRKFRIFICEGQSKTETAVSDRLLYHDGSQYALALLKRKFENVVIIPDITIWNLFRTIPIDFVLVGANGFNDEAFIHSAGHGSVITLARECRNRQGEERDGFGPRVVLVVSSEKWRSGHEATGISGASVSGREDEDAGGRKALIDGYYFWKGPDPDRVPTRENIWMLRDKKVAKELKEKKVMFYNPREDAVRIEDVDYIISDIGHLEIRPQGNPEAITNFMAAIRQKNRSRREVNVHA